LLESGRVVAAWQLLQELSKWLESPYFAQWCKVERAARSTASHFLANTRETRPSIVASFRGWRALERGAPDFAAPQPLRWLSIALEGTRQGIYLSAWPFQVLLDLFLGGWPGVS